VLWTWCSALAICTVTGLQLGGAASVRAPLFYSSTRGTEFCQDDLSKKMEIISPLFLSGDFPHGPAGSLQCCTHGEQHNLVIR